MEVELKLALSPKDVRRLQTHPLLRGTAAKRKHLHNIYFDTPDLKLSAEGSALRLRQQGDLWLQTVKCAGVVSGGLASRPEWETPYSGQFDFSVVDDKAVRSHLEHLLPRLTPIFETNFDRTTWCLELRPVARLLVMLDRGWVASQGRRDEICEVEIESAGATNDDLFALAASLAERVPLTPALRSKAERGYRLQADAKETPVHYALPKLAAHTAPLEAFRTIALACLEQIIANQAGAQQNEDAEYVHQMRVGTRRLRAAAQLFRPCLPEDFQSALSRTLSDLADCLGQVRDLDVLGSTLLKPALEALPKDRDLAALARHVTARHKEAAAHLRQVLGSVDYGRWLLKVSSELHRLPASSVSSDFPGFIEQRVEKLASRVRRQAKRARNGSAEHLHRLRIAAKRLRYALDVSPSNGKSHHVLGHAQEVLGHLNDLDRGFSLLAAESARRAPWKEAAKRLAAFHQERREHLQQSACDLVTELRHLRLPKPTAHLPRPIRHRNTMNIILWRHAEAEDPKPGQNDLDRKLTPKGKKQAKRMAKWLGKHLPNDARILVSPALRTKQTADALDMPYTIAPEIAPSAHHTDLAKTIDWPNAEGAVVIVGHQPTLGQLAAWLLTGNACDLSIAKGATWWLRASRKNGMLQVAVESVTPAKR